MGGEENRCGDAKLLRLPQQASNFPKVLPLYVRAAAVSNWSEEIDAEPRPKSDASPASGAEDGVNHSTRA